ncbi:MAG: hypothetical protein HY301_05455 [Verrucomicrobia bacterium]|nr:hypothetical protein [Verrucomicrobiota bacterium]
MLRPLGAMVLLCLLLAARPAPAQVVQDGHTNTLDSVTNVIAGNVTVGTNGSNTGLVLTNGALLTNSGTGTIGLNAGANSNTVAVQGTNAGWSLGGELDVGTSGSFNSFLIANGGTVANAFGIIGFSAGANNNQITVTGSNSVWTNVGVTNTGQVYIGLSGSSNTLLITNGAKVANWFSAVGYYAGANNNRAIVTDNALWTNSGSIIIGGSGSSNAMLITNGGQVGNFSGLVGYDPSGRNNQVTVTGTNSLWFNSGDLHIGEAGASNALLIADGGRVEDGRAYVGVVSYASDNWITVAGVNSLWSNRGTIYLGYDSPFNTLVISNGGTVTATNLTLGFDPSSVSNRLTVEGGTLRVTNVTGNGTLDVRRGTVVLNSGLIQANRLLMTNGSQADFQFNGGTLTADQFVLMRSPTGPFPFTFKGGTLITGGGIISNGLQFVVGANADFGPDTWDVRSNATPPVVYYGLDLGSNAANTTLLVTNGATLTVIGTSSLSRNVGSTNNLAIIAGPNSLWTNYGDLYIGNSGSFNALIVSNGGAVADRFSVIGYDPGANNNQVVVTGANSKWTNIELWVGNSGSFNTLLITNGGTVEAGKVEVGFGVSSSNNLLNVGNGKLTVTNATTNAVLSVRRGTLLFNGGTNEADRFVMTNTLATNLFNAGYFRTRGTFVSNSLPYTVGDGVQFAQMDLDGVGTNEHRFVNGLAVAAGALVQLLNAKVFTPEIDVNGGTLLLGGPATMTGRLGGVASVKLSGGTLKTAGLSDSAGTLTLNASSVIDLGSGASLLHFLNSSGAGWTGGAQLNIQNWSGSVNGGGTDQLILGNSTSGLTPAQLAQIKFVNPFDFGSGIFDATILSNGEVVPVPEPATVLAACALLSLLGWRERQRVRRVLRR